MRYKLEDILTFLTVIEAGGLTAAARRLGVAKSVASKRISDLESSLGATLLRRSARGVVPTEAGAAFYGRARDILAELDDAAASAAGAGELRGLMRVAGPLSFGTLHLAPVLVDFLARHPRVELALHLNDRVVDIIHEGYDLAVRIGRLRDSSLVRSSRSANAFCAVAPVTQGTPAFPAPWTNSKVMHASDMPTYPSVNVGFLRLNGRAVNNVPSWFGHV